MGKNVIHAAAVDIERFAQVLGTHGRALDVPPRPAGSDFSLPEGLSFFFRLPQGEIMDTLLLVLIDIHPLSRLELFEADLGEPAVSGELGDAEIARSVLFVSETLLDETSDDGPHLRDVFGRPRIEVSGGDIQGLGAGEESIDVLPGVVGKGDS